MKDKGYFEKNSIKIFTLLMVSNVCAYLFQLVLGRGLTVEHYGTINSLMALMSIMSAPSTAITAIATKYIAENSNENIDKIRQINSTIICLTAVMQLIMVCILVPCNNIIANVMHIQDSGVVLSTIAVCILSAASYPLVGIAQGLQKYSLYGFQDIAFNVVKVIVAAILIACGLAMYGVFLTFALAYVIEIIILVIGIRKYLNMSVVNLKKNRLLVKEMLLYYLSAFGIKTVVLILLNFDTILMKMRFAENEVGYYSSAMVIAKIGMYVTTALIVPLFPMAVRSNCSGEDPKPLLFKCMGYSVGFNILYALGILMFGKYVILLLYGEAYYSACELFIFVFPYVIGLSCIMVLMNYFLALGKGNFFTAVWGIAIGLIILIGLIASVEMKVMIVIMDIILVIAIVACLRYAVSKDTR